MKYILKIQRNKWAYSESIEADPMIN